MKAVRQRGWELALAKYVQSKRHEPFNRGTNDCVRFVAGAVQAMTGVDIAHLFRHRYSTDEDAIRLKATLPGGFAGTVESVCLEHGMTRLPGVLFAQRGDVMLLDEDGSEGVGICVGATIATPGKDGLLLVPLRTAKAGWRLPYGN